MYSKTMYGRPSSSPASITRDDVRVGEPRHSARLAPEALELVGVGGDLAVHQLDATDRSSVSSWAR